MKCFGDHGSRERQKGDKHQVENVQQQYLVHANDIAEHSAVFDSQFFSNRFKPEEVTY